MRCELTYVITPRGFEDRKRSKYKHASVAEATFNKRVNDAARFARTGVGSNEHTGLTKYKVGGCSLMFERFHNPNGTFLYKNISTANINVAKN